MFRGVKLPNECSHKINNMQGHRQSLQLETWQLEERKKTQRKRKEKQHNCRLEERLVVRARAKADSLVSLHPLPPHHASGKPPECGQKMAQSTALESASDQNQTAGSTRKSTQVGIPKKWNHVPKRATTLNSMPQKPNSSTTGSNTAHSWQK